MTYREYATMDRLMQGMCADYGGVRHPRWFRLSV